MESDVPRFDRRFVDPAERFSAIGSGALGGKAAGLREARAVLAAALDRAAHPAFDVDVPTLTVIRTDFFDRFLEQNDLLPIIASGAPDDRLAHAFQRAQLPAELVGDLRALVNQVRTPLAVRSSSLLEDALKQPFAGVYGTKMIPNNQPDPDARFRKLVEAIKFVYASTFFEQARAYAAGAIEPGTRDRMAVIVQEVVGRRHRNRFYPEVAGVARSHNFYPRDGAEAADGVVLLALGLGKTIVDGGIAWSYSPRRPRATPPYASVRDLMDNTQTSFWAVNMGNPPAYNPMAETEYLLVADLADAEADETLRHVASTYDGRADRLVPGVGTAGARAVTFSPLLVLEEPPLNDLLTALLRAFTSAMGAMIEIEFALAFPPGRPARFGFLQVRPMVVSDQVVDIDENDVRSEAVLVGSPSVLGNGTRKDLRDIVYVRPDRFEASQNRRVAEDVGAVNRSLVDARRPFLLIGFGRWGSSDPWLGPPVNWSDISGARAIVEAAGAALNVEASQGSHFFHNVSSFQVPYFSVSPDRGGRIDWEWLERQTVEGETALVRHLRLARPLEIAVDGRSGRGVIRKPS
jgi:hypothetical protein